MKILALDSSGLVATVAIIEDNIMRAEYTINYKKTHSQTLLPMIDEIVAMTDTDLSSIDAIAVAGGPGSFTGLRIGSATAKGLGLALEKPIINVPTVIGLAYNYEGYGELICPMMDARRNQVYTGVYSFENGELVTFLAQCAISIEELVDQLKDIMKTTGNEKSLLFLGDGVPVQRSYLEEACPSAWKYHFAPAHMNGQRAGALGSYAMKMWQQAAAPADGANGLSAEKDVDEMLVPDRIDERKKFGIETAAEHHPDYLRLSQAERERAEREKD